MRRLSLEMWFLMAPDFGGSDPVHAFLPKPGRRGCMGSLQLPGTPAAVRVPEGLYSARPSGLRRGLKGTQMPRMAECQSPYLRAATLLARRKPFIGPGTIHA